jgi:hypothetical protein
MATRALPSPTAAAINADSGEQGRAADGTALQSAMATGRGLPLPPPPTSPTPVNKAAPPMVIVEKNYDKPMPAFLSIKSSSDCQQLGMQPRHTST